MAHPDFFNVPSVSKSINLAQIIYVAWQKEQEQLVATLTYMNGGAEVLKGDDGERLRSVLDYLDQGETDKRKKHGGIHV